MSEGDVSLIHDEDLLRRMVSFSVIYQLILNPLKRWQQTEDFSRKKEIRAHMYRLREERLRNLYSPEPPLSDGKGCEFTSAQGHVKSFADQTFQSMKSKEVRDAGSPPKEFTYRGQDLKELSNAGWNVESENRTTDDGHTHVKSVHANIEGRYDVEGGRGQFAAIDKHTQAATEYQDRDTSVKRNESSSDTAAREHVVRQTDDGAQFSSITSSSTSSSKFQQVSSTKHENVPYLTNDDYDLSRRTSYDSERNEEVIKKGVTEDSKLSVTRHDISKGELMSRKIEYPDENTKIIVETRCLPDGTRVTSTRREFRAPVVESTRSENHSQQTRNERKSYETSSQQTSHTSSQQKSHTNESVSQTRQQTTDNTTNIVDSQRLADDNDVNQNQETRYKSTIEDIGYDTKTKERVINEINKRDTDRVKSQENKQSNINQHQTRNVEVQNYYDKNVNKTEEVVNSKTVREEYQTTYSSDYSQKKISQDWSPSHQAWASTLRADTPTLTRPLTRESSPGSRTFVSSTSSLRRSASPDKTCRKPPSRDDSPNKIKSQSPTRNYSDNYTVSHSTHTISETKTNKYEGRPPHGRSPTRPSPEKTERKSVSPDKKNYERRPTHSSPDRQTSTKTSPINETTKFEDRPRHTPSPDRRPIVDNTYTNRSTSPSKFNNENVIKTLSPRKSPTREPKKSTSPTRESQKINSTNVSMNDRISPSKIYPGDNNSPSNSPVRNIDSSKEPSPHRLSTSPDRKPGYMRPTAASQSQNIQTLPSAPSKHPASQSPDRKSPLRNVNTDTSSVSNVTKVKEDHYKFIDEETKMYSRTDDVVKGQTNGVRKSPSPSKQLPFNQEKAASDRPSIQKESRSPSPSKGPVTFIHQQIENEVTKSKDNVDFVKYTDIKIKRHRETNKKDLPLPTKYTGLGDNPPKDSSKPSSKDSSPINYGTYDKKERYSAETNDEIVTEIKSPRKVSDSLTNKSPRVSTSPLKSVNTQHKTTSDFITTERFTEHLNNKTSTISPKGHPRQLVTPSSSPTRNSKTNETEPSTGQSSPTTSVSGFIYYSSPVADRTIVTDLDEQESYTNINEEKEVSRKSSKTLRNSGSPSPSKIPCRSPSPEKRNSLSNEHLPRKSSLKKTIPVDDKSPPEKPPSDFRVPPTVETQDHLEHKIVKKDRPDKPETVTKSKPPLERRETYEERCRKILGMMDDNNQISKKTKDTHFISSSPVTTSETSTIKDSRLLQNADKTKTDDILTTDIIDKTVSKVSRERNVSPTKLQDIMSLSETISHEKGDLNSKLLKQEDEFLIKNNKPKRLSTSPEKKLPRGNTSVIQNQSEVLQHEKHIRNISPTKINQTTDSFDSNKDEISSTTMTSQSFLRQETYDVDNSSVLTKDIDNSFSTLSPSNDVIEPKRLRTPSPEKNRFSPIQKTEKILVSEREQEILDRVQKSLRNLSPNRAHKTPSREQSPNKCSITPNKMIRTEENDDKTICIKGTIRDEIETYQHKTCDKTMKSNDVNLSNKTTKRTPSPVKKATSLPSPTKLPTDSFVKPRSVSPKKSTTPAERPQSPQVPNTSGTKREAIPLFKKTSIKIEKLTNTISENKRPVVTKQNSFTKISPTKITNKPTQAWPSKSIDTETKTKNIKSNIKENNTQKNYSESKVTRTVSDISIKTKKSPPQRMKSKPEIKVSEATTTKQASINKKHHKPCVAQTNLPSKPKSATALNTPLDDDDIIIDVQQAKSSRESSPDRICPTPVNYTEDISTPRYPDEINEPDDEFRKRTYQTIHETESIVDDIVEICEDEELFVKNTNESYLTDDNHVLKKNKVDKSNNNLKQSKYTTEKFKDTERNEHSDFNTEQLKSDECLLSVSEKVNKFARGPNKTNDEKIPPRKLVDEYDSTTTYQDDYTKLSVNDKAHLFVETAENLKAPKMKPNTKVQRPDFENVEEFLKTDDCLLSVSDKVNKFVKTAEQFLTQTHEAEEKERKINEQHEIIMKKILKNVDNKSYVPDETAFEKKDKIEDLCSDSVPTSEPRQEKRDSFTKETVSSFAKVKDHHSSNLKPQEKAPTVKITTLRSSEAVKKAKALFENIASTQKKDTSHVKCTKLTDIGVMKKSPKTDSTIALHPSEEGSPNLTDADSELDIGSRAPETRKLARHQPSLDNKPRSSPSRHTPQSSVAPRIKSPVRQTFETVTVSQTCTNHSPTPKLDTQNIHKQENLKTETAHVPSYQRPTKTSQMKEEVKTIEETEVSSRRGSGKFGVELRRTSIERSTVSSERRRSSTEHHQPCIEDVLDLDLLEQMLEKVVGYEQRRRIRAQIRLVKQRMETRTESDRHTKTTKYTTLNISKTRSPDRHSVTKSPERQPRVTTQKPTSPDRQRKPSPHKTVTNHSYNTVLNGKTKESVTIAQESRHRPRSPDKQAPKSQTKPQSPLRQPSLEKKTRPTSPSKAPTKKPKTNRFSEYASAYLKKVGGNDKEIKEKIKTVDVKTNKATQDLGDCKVTYQSEEHEITETKTMTSKSYSERTSSRDVIEVTHVNGKRSPSPEKKRSPDRKTQAPTERLREKSPSPILKRQLSDTGKKETRMKSHDIEKNVQNKNTQEEKPSWVTNRNLKKISSETRTFSSRKMEHEKPKYRAPSPSKAISKPLDVITSSYGPGPLDADGKPLFGIKALRNGATNYQVKGTVIRQEFHSRDGGAPEGSVSVTAYGSGPALDALLAAQGERPSRLHGLAAITTTRRFGGDTGVSYTDVHTKEERAALDQFTHNDRRVSDSSVKITEMISDENLQDSRHKTIHTSHDRHEETRQNTEQTRQKADQSRQKIDQSRQKIDQSRQQTEQSRQKLEQSRQKTEDLRQNRKQSQRSEERHERIERREDRKTVRQSSVKSLTEKFIKNASETSKAERSAYPKAGLILRTAGMKDSVSSDSSAHAGLARTDSEHSLGSVEEVVVSSSTGPEGRPVVTSQRGGSSVVTSQRGGRTVTERDSHGGRTVTERDSRTAVSTDRGGRTVTTTTTRVRTRTAPAPASAPAAAPAARQERSFLDSTTKVTGVQDILTRMRNADIVIQEGDSSEDSEARALLNKFLGATVLMAGMQGYVAEPPRAVQQETVRSSSRVVASAEELDLDQCWDERLLNKLVSQQETVRSSSSRVVASAEELDLDQCWDERLLNKLLDECADYEQRRRLRARIRTLMAEQEACAAAVTEALAASGESAEAETEATAAVEAEAEVGASGDDEREEEEVTTVTSSVRRNSSEKSVSSSTTTNTTKVIESMTKPAPKPVSPFAKFRQLEKQNSTNSPNSPKTPQSPGSQSQPFFKFTDPALQASALTIKERLLQWCRDKTRDYENVKLENFSTSWADGLAFCALVHHFLPDTFDYSRLTPDKRRHNFTLAFKVADEKAGIYPLLDVDDMVAMRKPDWKCVFTYVQAIHRRFKDQN